VFVLCAKYFWLVCYWPQGERTIQKKRSYAMQNSPEVVQYGIDIGA
jgi:hypothetical protein